MEITEEKAREIYPNMPESFKRELEEYFGKETFISSKLVKLLEYKNALEMTGNPDAKTLTDIPEKYHDYFLKEYKCIVLCEAANGGERMDIYNQNVKRYFPYFLTNGSPGAFAFSDSLYDDSHAIAGSGSRLSVINEKAARHLGKMFTKEFREMLEA